MIRESGIEEEKKNRDKTTSIAETSAQGKGK